MGVLRVLSVIVWPYMDSIEMNGTLLTTGSTCSTKTYAAVDGGGRLEIRAWTWRRGRPVRRRRLRSGRVEIVRKQIVQGTYDLPRKFDIAADLMIESILRN
jgi:hypothetical protein